MSSHLGDRVAAFVDGQMSYAAREKALHHLADCAECRAAVEQQRWVKATVQTLPGAEPSADLLSTLTRVPMAGPEPTSWHAPSSSRWFGPGRGPYGPLGRGGLLLAGVTSLAAGYLGVAYAVGGPTSGGPDPVTPPVGRFSTEFAVSDPSAPFAEPAMDAFPVIGGLGRTAGP